MDAERFLSVFAGRASPWYFHQLFKQRKHFSFPRLCAVFGGVYCLKRSITEIYFSNADEKLVFDAIQCDKQKIQAKHIVFGHGTISGARFENATGKDSLATEKRSHAGKKCCGNLSRAVFLTDTPIGDESLNSGGGGVIFLKIPSANGDSDGAFVIQLSHWSGCCPKGFCKPIRLVIVFFLQSKTSHIFLRSRSYHMSIIGNIGQGWFSAICWKIIRKLPVGGIERSSCWWCRSNRRHRNFCTIATANALVNVF